MVDWMYWITAIVFTFVGFFLALGFNQKMIVQSTIDTLIDNGYIKTRVKDGDVEIVKYDE